MVPQKASADGDVPAKQVNNILQNLRGEHFRHARNVQGRPASSNSLLSHAHNQPTLPINLIYPSPAPVIQVSAQWIPGPSPPKSWRFPTTAAQSPASGVKSDVDTTNITAWRERALCPLFSADATLSSSSSESTHSPLTYLNSSSIPQLTILCLQLIRSNCPGADLAEVVPYIPLHLRRTLLRYAAIHAPLSQAELDVLCEGTTHVDSELVIVGPHNLLRGSSFRKNDPDTDVHRDDPKKPNESWDTTHPQDGDLHVLCSLAILSSPLSVAAMLAFPPTITHLALVNISHRIPLQRLPMTCPLLIFLDVSYNTWLHTPQVTDKGRSILEEVEWTKWRRLEVVVLRGCPVTAKLLLELNKGRWEDIKVVQ